MAQSPYMVSAASALHTAVVAACRQALGALGHADASGRVSLRPPRSASLPYVHVQRPTEQAASALSDRDHRGQALTVTLTAWADDPAEADAIGSELLTSLRAVSLATFAVQDVDLDLSEGRYEAEADELSESWGRTMRFRFHITPT